MTSSYIIFWNKDRIETYSKNGDIGPLSVIFGGPHQSQPTLGKIKIGDIIFPITVIDGAAYILGRMEIEAIITEKEFLKNNIIENVGNLTWDEYRIKYNDRITHKIPWNCMERAAIGKNGTKIIKRKLPKEKIDLIKLGAKEGQETLLKIKDGKIQTSNLIGYFRKLSKDSEKIFNEIIENTRE
jgi:hypothetical protein